MPNLPPGWRLSNSDGSFSGPPQVEEEASGSDEDHSDDEIEDNVDVQPDSPGWEDVDPDADTEIVDVKCLLCDLSFPKADSMLDHCNHEHGLDFLAVRRRHNLDFYSTIKLVNYIRLAAREGTVGSMNMDSPASWADEQFLQPVLENDALLFTLDDLVDFEEDATGVTETHNSEAMDAVNGEQPGVDGRG